MRHRLLALASLVTAVFIGCASPPRLPERPRRPAECIETVSEVIKRGLAEPRAEWVERVSLKDSALGVLEFEGTVGGSLATTSIQNRLAKLEREGELKNVLDRATIDEVRRELELAQDADAGLTQEQIAARLGKLVVADYLLVGSVTRYESEQKSVSLKSSFRAGEFKRYQTEYARFDKRLDAIEAEASTMSVEKSLQVFGGPDDETTLQRVESLRRATKRPEQFEEEIRSKRGQEFSNVAYVALNARLIQVETSEVVWTYEWEVADQSLTTAMNSILDDLTARLVKKN